MDPSIFKAYDVRGIYPDQINENILYKIGRLTPNILSLKTIAVGRDARHSGAQLMEALIQGLNDAGCNVINLGLLTTPMLYFSSWYLDVDGAISVTASHNPAEYNGIKICKKNAVPVGEASGLNDIRDAIVNSPDTKELETPSVRGTEEPGDIKDAYRNFVGKFARLGETKYKIVVDSANTMGVLELPIYRLFPKNIEIIELYCDLNNAYGAHEANPLNTETLTELQEKVKKEKADLGISYDGDADRIGFVDETGRIIPMDLITGLIARVLLTKNPGSTVLYDLRSSKTVREVIEENGGIAKECRVGHAFIKTQMREENALFAGELSGHYYFQANKNGELSTLAALTLLNLMHETQKPISELINDLRRYHHSGEINSEVSNKDAIIKALEEAYSDANISHLDGIKIAYSNWWFNVRPSNTEPVLRLNLEADTKELMEQKRDEVLAVIRQ